MAFRVEAEPGPDGEPIPVRVGRGGALERVREVLDRWPGEGYAYFRLRAESGDVLIVRREQVRGATRWELVYYERQTPSSTGSDPAG